MEKSKERSLPNYPLEKRVGKKKGKSLSHHKQT